MAIKRNRDLNLEKREAILTASIDELYKKGYAACNMNSIAEKANVSKATVYKHFGSKQELFFAIMNMLLEQVNTHVFIEYDDNKTLESQLTEFANKKMELLCDPQNLVLMKIATIVLTQEETLAEELKKDFKDHIMENLVEWFATASKAGKMKIEDPLFVTMQFLGSIKSFAFHPQLFGAPILSKTEQEKVVKTAVEAILLQYKI